MCSGSPWYPTNSSEVISQANREELLLSIACHRKPRKIISSNRGATRSTTTRTIMRPKVGPSRSRLSIASRRLGSRFSKRADRKLASTLTRGAITAPASKEANTRRRLHLRHAKATGRPTERHLARTAEIATIPPVNRLVVTTPMTILSGSTRTTRDRSANHSRLSPAKTTRSSQPEFSNSDLGARSPLIATIICARSLQRQGARVGHTRVFFAT